MDVRPVQYQKAFEPMLVTVLGILTEVILLQRTKAHVPILVTEYSFPSKDIEYMATGIPALLCVLPGMPKEYQGRFVDMGDGSPGQIAAAIQKVKAMSSQERERIGKKAKDFITERMNCHKQGQRITKLFNRVINNNSIC